MASSHNLASMEPWTFHPYFTDSLFPETFAFDYEALTKALQNSLSGSSSDTVSPFLNLVSPDTTPSPTVSDHETAPKQKRSTVLSPSTGKVSKRKSRASKRPQTTFITADPLNFRQMVQQVTGVRLDSSQMPMAPILKPEPQRPRSRLPSGGELFLPTLDTSSFLLDHQQQKEEAVGSTPAAVPAVSAPAPTLTFEAPLGVVDADLDSPASEFDAYLNFPTHFPTLESWKHVRDTPQFYLFQIFDPYDRGLRSS